MVREPVVREPVVREPLELLGGTDIVASAEGSLRWVTHPRLSQIGCVYFSLEFI